MRRWISLVVVLLLAACGNGAQPGGGTGGAPSASQSGAVAGAVCDLARSAEIAAATGLAVAGFRKPVLPPDRECTWSLAPATGVEGAARQPFVDATFFGGKAQYDAISTGGEPLPGLGEEAYREPGNGIVGVLQHGRFFAVSVVLHEPGLGTPALTTAEDAAALAIAKVIASRL
jgi:hypothetical protein